MERRLKNRLDAAPPEVERVLEASQQNLADFLRVEIQLAFSLLEVLKTTRDGAEREEHLRATIRSAIETVRRFELRLVDGGVRKEVLRKAEQLTSALNQQSQPRQRRP